MTGSGQGEEEEGVIMTGSGPRRGREEKQPQMLARNASLPTMPRSFPS
jgi:hypothetical protein